MNDKRCELCGRTVGKLERHHLIPRTRHKNKQNKKAFERREVHERIAMLCGACHDMLHATFGAKELEREYATLSAIRRHPGIRKFVRWVRRRSPGKHVRVRRAAISARPARGLSARDA